MNRLCRIPLQYRCLLGNLQSRNTLITRNIIGTKPPTSEQDKEDPEKPMQFFGTQAERVRATPQMPIRPTYSPYIVHISLAIFLIYFLILREENDIDDLLKRDLYDHFGEEASRLKKAYDYNVKHNLPTAEIINRLREIGAPVPPHAR